MEINSKASTLFLALVILSFFHHSLVSCQKVISNRGRYGFTLDLIHCDSPLSPFYNPSNTPSERLQNAFHRSFSRASFFKKNSVNGIQSTITPTPADYLMKISIGTPPVDSLVFADTGSDLTWTQCEPCVDCFKQLAPTFNPKNSSSYKTVGCNTKICQQVGYLCKNNTCTYDMSYDEEPESHSGGDLSIETFTFASTSGENVSIPNIVFGCGHANSGMFTNATSGIVGLGGGIVSIVNQMNQEIKRKFSYCLIPLESSTNSNTTSHINFGDNAVVAGPGVVSTPLIRSQRFPTYYFLTLESISVGNMTLPFRSSKINSSHQGNIIVDSGTTVTFVPFDFYANLEKILVASINANRKDDPFGFFKVCYESKNGTIDAPKIVAHFTNADVELPPTNTFTQVQEGLVCFTMMPEDGLVIFGNLAQMNFLIGYDLVANKLSFLPTDCSKY